MNERAKVSRRMVPLVLAAAVSVVRVARASARYTTRGVVKSFGKDRRYVNIAHEDIPGYMKAMTMAFMPQSAAQLAALNEGDRVELTFVDEDGRRIIEQIVRLEA